MQKLFFTLSVLILPPENQDAFLNAICNLKSTHMPSDINVPMELTDSVLDKLRAELKDTNNPLNQLQASTNSGQEANCT